ncbi:MAG: hypothetical protein JXR95_06750 [Deltaproteobacteria bacterium]|nr:hypothetical protein [Deltaproteobacteria bacterium]
MITLRWNYIFYIFLALSIFHILGCTEDDKTICQDLYTFEIKDMYVEPQYTSQNTCQSFYFHYDNTTAEKIDLPFRLTGLDLKNNVREQLFILEASPGYHLVTVSVTDLDPVHDIIIAEILDKNDENCESVAYYNIQPDKRLEYLVNDTE